MPKKKSPTSAEPTEAAAQPAPPREPTLPKGKRGRVFLIDAYSFVFRAYHAMARQRPMSTRSGLPTGATYVFVNMLNKLRKDFAPEYIAAVFDIGPSFREKHAEAMPALRKVDRETGEVTEVEYAGYKANRAEMPEDLRQQMPYIRRALEVYRVPMLGLEGYEADDVIGTLAKRAAAEDFAVYVVSSDKDMMQLVDERVCVLNPPKENLIVDRAGVEAVLGVPPERVVDVMALRGDAVDNVPGAPGIGDKGSVELIQKFGSLDNLLAHASEVEKNTYRKSLEGNRPRILLSRDLVTISTDADVPFEPETMKAQSPDVAAARELFTELEFNSLLREFLEQGTATSETGETSYGALSAEALERMSKAALLAVAVDAPQAEEENEESEEESDGQKALTLEEKSATPSAQQVALSDKPGEAMSGELHGPLQARLAEVIGDAALPKAVHDSKTAGRALAAAGAELAGVKHDTMLYAYLLDPTYSRYGLADVALRDLGLRLAGSLPEAADVTLRLAAKLSAEVDEHGLRKVYDEIDLPMAPVLARMEDAGIRLDAGALAGLSKRLESDAAAKAKRIHELAGSEFNINSPKQLGDVLFNRLMLPKPVKYGKGKTISTAQDVLEGLAADHEIAGVVLEFRQVTKLKSTYVDALPGLCDESGRLHTSFNATGAATGRLSSTNPNLQNIPVRSELGREIRAAFVPEAGWLLLSADYSQIELRLLAHFSEDPLLVEAYQRGDDIHALTAAKVFGVPPMLIDAEQRRRAKAVNFGIVYGLSAFGLAKQIGIDTKEAKRFIDAYFERYIGVRRWIDATLEQARRDGLVRTMHGRVRPIPDILSKNPNLRGFAERTAVNTPLQGTAADLIKLAMIEIDRELLARGMKSRMLLQVHDELVFECPPEEMEAMRGLAKEKMESAALLKAPLVVELSAGKNWRDME